MGTESLVRDILKSKASDTVWTVRPDETVFAALKRMALYNVGALLVMEHQHVVGIITERDYARKVVLRDRSSRTTLVREIMDHQVLFVTPDDSAEGCLALMTEKRIRHLPVYENEELIGLVSMGDVVKAVFSDREYMIDHLTRYITGSYSGIFDGLSGTRALPEVRIVPNVESW